MNKINNFDNSQVQRRASPHVLTISALIASFFFASAAALGQTAPPLEPAASPAPEFTGNLALVSDYRFRGVSQTYGLPAVQGGIDYANPGGLYLGTWMSNVSGNQYMNGASLEWDMYGGYKASVTPDFSYDTGLLYYYYPGSHYNDPAKTRYNNLEVYGAVTWKWLMFKYNRTLGNYFGTDSDTFGGTCEDPRTGSATNCMGPTPGSSKGSGYADLTLTYEFAEKTNVVVHAGHQEVRHCDALAYTDYKLGVTRETGYFTIGASLVGTNARAGRYTVAEIGNSGDYKVISREIIVLSINKAF
jgi:hypothetical protein